MLLSGLIQGARDHTNKRILRSMVESPFEPQNPESRILMIMWSLRPRWTASILEPASRPGPRWFRSERCSAGPEPARQHSQPPRTFLGHAGTVEAGTGNKGSMHTCVCVYIHVCMSMYERTLILCMHACMHACMHVHVSICRYT